MKQNNYLQGLKTYYAAVFISVLVIITLFFVSLSVGRYNVAAKEVIDCIFGKEVAIVSKNVILKLRIPRTLMAILVGAGLSLSGAIYQGIFNNKIVSPDLLGVSSGASVGACFSILLGFSSFQIIICSFVFGFITVFLSIGITILLGNKANISLVLSGIAIGGLMSSIIGLTKYLADTQQKLEEITYWLLGDLSHSVISDVVLIFPIIFISSTIACLYANKIDALSLGKRDAKALGVNYTTSMLILIMCATINTAVSVAFCGVIGWIGLSIPNIVRLFFGNQHRKVLVLSLLFGSIFLMATDMLARTLSPNEIPLSVVTGVIGTPLFLFAIVKKRKELS